MTLLTDTIRNPERPEASRSRSSGEIGKHKGLKIPRCNGLPVRFRPGAQKY